MHSALTANGTLKVDILYQRGHFRRITMIGGEGKPLNAGITPRRDETLYVVKSKTVCQAANQFQ
jgi:hypothetical protein